jgi:hypothetical protein
MVHGNVGIDKNIEIVLQCIIIISYLGLFVNTCVYEKGFYDGASKWCV